MKNFKTTPIFTQVNVALLTAKYGVMPRAVSLLIGCNLAECDPFQWPIPKSKPLTAYAPPFFAHFYQFM